MSASQVHGLKDIHPNGRWIVIGTSNGSIEVWEIPQDILFLNEEEAKSEPLECIDEFKFSIPHMPHGSSCIGESFLIVNILKTNRKIDSLQILKNGRFVTKCSQGKMVVWHSLDESDTPSPLFSWTCKNPPNSSGNGGPWTHPSHFGIR
jgi:hypothetical protein